MTILPQFDSRILSSEIPPDSVPTKAAISHRDSDDLVEEIRVPTIIDSVLDENFQVCVPILGFTASFGRSDKLALGKIFQKIVWHSEFIDMIDAGW